MNCIFGNKCTNKKVDTYFPSLYIERWQTCSDMLRAQILIIMWPSSENSVGLFCLYYSIQNIRQVNVGRDGESNAAKVVGNGIRTPIGAQVPVLITCVDMLHSILLCIYTISTIPIGSLLIFCIIARLGKLTFVVSCHNGQ